jgi:cyclic pyranopterin monophosphate synthase
VKTGKTTRTRSRAAETSRSSREGRGIAKRLSHVDPSGQVRMVDVSEKAQTAREAVACGSISISPRAMRLIQSGRIAKGDPLQLARIAGIMAAKRTADLVPLCHQLPLSHVDVGLHPEKGGYRIEAVVRTTAATGVEMEALTAVAVAALTVYDMVKAVDREMVIGEIMLLEKRGGRSGEYLRATPVARDARRHHAGRRSARR